MYVYELDPALSAYVATGIHHNRLKLDVPFPIEIDLTAISRRRPWKRGGTAPALVPGSALVSADEIRALMSAAHNDRLTWNTPLSEEHAAQLVAACAPDAGARIVDLGSGWGELLMRLVESAPGSTGDGVETDSEAVARGRELAGERGSRSAYGSMRRLPPSGPTAVTTWPCPSGPRTPGRGPPRRH